uniref:(northern house mosquito) hypothetical protein n=1 Tax=Culex pipiens TaxID=7175 RepID=A0A8D8CHD9_CULPI
MELNFRDCYGKLHRSLTESLTPCLISRYGVAILSLVKRNETPKDETPCLITGQVSKVLRHDCYPCSINTAPFLVQTSLSFQHTSFKLLNCMVKSVKTSHFLTTSKQRALFFQDVLKPARKQNGYQSRHGVLLCCQLSNRNA